MIALITGKLPKPLHLAYTAVLRYSARSLCLRLTGEGRRITSQAVRLAVAVDEELFADAGEHLREQLQAVAAHRLAGLLPPPGTAAG